jgi:predicted secreted protein
MDERSRLMGERGVMTYMIGLSIVIVFLILLWTVFLPMIQTIQIKTFASQQDLLSDTNEAIHSLPAGTTKDSLIESFNAELDSTTTNFDIIAFFMQYWWVFTVVIVSFGTYVLARRNVEVQGF